MTFYEQLEKHLSVKQHVLVQDEDGDYCVFSHFKNSDGNWRNTPFGEYEIAMAYIGCASGYKKEEMNKRAKEKKWKIIKAFDSLQVDSKLVIRC